MSNILNFHKEDDGTYFTDEQLHLGFDKEGVIKETLNAFLDGTDE